MTLRRRIFLFIVFLCSSVVLSLAQPKLEVVGGTHYDLGIINEGVVVTRRVVFKNTGTDSLRIDSITTSCGCTLAKPSSNVAASGDSLSLTITFDTKNLSGPVRKHIFFYTNDSEQLYDSIAFDASIHPTLEIVPHYINFYTTPVGTPVVRSFAIINNTDTTIRILQLLSPNRRVVPKLNANLLPPHKQTTVDVTFTASEQSRVLGQLLLRTDFPGKDSVRVSYKGEAK